MNLEPSSVADPAAASTAVSPERFADLPLVVGVSGHRDLHPDDIGRVTAVVAEFFDELASRAAKTEIRVMAGMAQGADLLVAQLALDRGLCVDAVLPMPLADYLEDFGVAARATLTRLLAHPNVRTVELLARPTDTSRDSRYAELTDLLVRKSDVLLALWDGEPSVLPGGTADTLLRFVGARTMVRVETAQVLFVDEIPDSEWGPQFAFWAPTRRSAASSNVRRHEPCFLSSVGENVLCRHPRMPLELAHQLSGLNRYNRDFAQLRADPGFAGAESLLSELQAAPDVEFSNLRAIDAVYGKSDALARRYQKLSDRLFGWFGYIALLMGVCFLIYAKLSSSKVYIFGYLLALGLGLAVFYGVERKHWFSKHLAYRVLAETMRAKFFLRSIGADNQVNVRELVLLTNIHRFEEFSWIINALRSVDALDVDQGASTPQADQSRADWARKVWVDGQIDYFKAKIAKLQRMSQRLDKNKARAVGVLLLLTIVLLAFGGRLHAAHFPGGASFKDAILFLMGLVPMMLGIWELYENKLATRELLWQYRAQLHRFSRARLQLAQATTWAQSKEILMNLSKESLMESYLWSIHRYHREHEPPAAG